MHNLIGYFLVLVVPGILGVLAIAIPFRSHRATRQDRFLTLGVINAVLCGLAVIALLATAVLNGYPTYLPYIVIALGFSAMLLLEAIKWVGRRKPSRPPEPTSGK